MQPVIYIYQLKNIKETKFLHNKSLEELQAFGKNVEFDNYEKVWTKPADPEDVEELNKGNVMGVLEYYYNILNGDELPGDYTGANLAVSDVIGVFMNGEINAYYVDQEGFEPVDYFFPEGFEKEAEQEFNYSDDFENLPGFTGVVGNPQSQAIPQARHERHFYTSLYLDMGSDINEEEMDIKMQEILEAIKEKHPEFAFTIHDAETNVYYE